MNRRSFLKLASTSLVALGGFKYISVERYWYQVQYLNITLPKLAPAFKGFTLTHLTDLHLNEWNSPERFSQVVEMVNQLETDIIVITGDFIDDHTKEDLYEDIIYQLSQLKAAQGVYAVLGNHDHWHSHRVVRTILKESGISDISNSIQTFSQDGETLYLCGLDDYREHKQDLPAVTNPLPEDACAILLIHEPDYADISTETNKFSLQLSGHTHGGQVYLPLIGPPVLPRYGRKYPRGLYQVGDMLLYTNSGVGMSPPRVRFNCRPEIAHITLS